MNHTKQGMSDQEMEALRQGIRLRYLTYHERDRDRYPELDYNTNRANYKPLRASFEEELFGVRGLDRQTPSIYIPSINTLALLFTDNDYRPGKKILNTCLLFAAPTPFSQTATDSSPVVDLPSTPRLRSRLTWPWGAGFLLLVGYGLLIIWQWYNRTAQDLVIYQPHRLQVVSRLVPVAGEVTHANEVWLVVHPMINGEKFYVQNPIVVDKQGKWKGNIIIGPLHDPPVDVPFEIRAFIHPGGAYRAFEETGTTIFDAWPEKAELATEPIVVIRKSKT